ncbi:glycoside hydrolase family 25 protein [Parasporobacterium paucivorans]|uniref:Glycosyl hydrolases family 25 n=1 Tax=Parasporobacterium paucivorans DSM 15970 TaxID=1122934 RepID=A0A1M6K7T6_9FIRM|nr:GH25 family lysozyme [Parasporobacterium paucivorans]SHJ54973.1 Glycosyl hydrolases family 25 [Parasporobacterium paucivorans DSM 15970]
MKMKNTRFNGRLIVIGASAVVLASAAGTAFVFTDHTDTSAETSVAPEDGTVDKAALLTREDIENYLYEKNLISMAHAHELLASRPVLTLKVSSVGSRVSVKIVLPDGNLATGNLFVITLTDEAGTRTEYTNNDMDGWIIIDNLEKGDYAVSMNEMKDFVTPASPTVTVEGEVAPVAVANIEEKVVSEAKIVVAEEDAAYGNVTTAETVQDTPAPETTASAPTETSAETSVQPVFTGWQTFDGSTYYYDGTGNRVTGWQTIGGLKYYFNESGVKSSKVGVDVSRYQYAIDWAAVKASGVDYAIIRLGYRGYGSGALVLDPYYIQNIRGASAAGLQVGVYFFSQAITETEAVEEASMVLEYIRGYNISCPVAFDTEFVNDVARANNLSATDRTTIALAFCRTIANAGYTSTVYASKSFLYNNLELSRLSGYQTWLAHYVNMTDYAYDYDMWQYTSKGSINGISTGVDLNVWLNN